MKYLSFCYLVALLIFLPFFSNAQKLTCTTHSRTNAILAQQPEKKAMLDQLEREYQEYLMHPEQHRDENLKVIPTVVHIIHDNGTENLSKQTILNAIDAVNAELRGQNPNISSVVPEFAGIVGDPEFELRLAKIDANGNCTDGITRTVSQQTYAGDEDLKDLINWNTGTRRYLQVWVVNTVGSGAGGYTYLPGTVNAQRNGIILRAAQFQGSLAHEFGHWMNLSHTWGPTNDPGQTSNCSFDDGVNDTPLTIGSSGCDLAQESCGSLDNVQNHMDYSSCARMFTTQQAQRMQSAANSSTGERNYYWSTTNLMATGTNDGYVASSCVPEVDFSFDEALGCEGLEVEFDDNLWGADEDPSWTWNWSFPGGTPATSTDPNPTVVYNNAGVYDVTLTVTTDAGSNTRTFTDAITVTPFGGGVDAQLTEGIENTDFPNNIDPMLTWEVENASGVNWQRTTTASFTGDASVRVNLRSVTEGETRSLISPPIDMSDVDTEDAFLTFRMAHANRNATDHDERLRVYASRNCGETWTLRYTKTGDALNTAGGFVTSTFVPESSEWREETVSLATMAGEEHVLIRFEARSDRQSYLYIDDININPNATSTTGVNDIETLSDIGLYPNPVNENSQLRLNLSEGGTYTFELYDVLGKQLSVITKELGTGLNRIPLQAFNASLDAGFYLVQISTDSGRQSVRFVKN